MCPAAGAGAGAWLEAEPLREPCDEEEPWREPPPLRPPPPPDLPPWRPPLRWFCGRENERGGASSGFLAISAL